jgi:curli biogenesis system outer membrane secretion channel CsgG
MIKPRLSALPIAVLATGCFATRVSVPRMAPAEIDVGGHERLAVGGVSGRGGDQIAAELTRTIFATNRFEVLDRQDLKQLTKEQDFQISGELTRSYALEPEDRTAAEIVKLKQFKIDDAELAKQQAAARNAR